LPCCRSPPRSAPTWRAAAAPAVWSAPSLPERDDACRCHGAGGWWSRHDHRARLQQVPLRRRVAVCRYPEDRVPRIQASCQDNGSSLPAGGSSEAAMCLRGSGSRSQLGVASGLPRAPTARGSSRAAMCPRSSGQLRGHQMSLGHQHSHSGVEQLWSCHASPGLCGLQANKQISPDDPAIMISIGACTRISSKALRDTGCSTRSKACSRLPIKCR
jgi:hypothetical protein